MEQRIAEGLTLLGQDPTSAAMLAKYGALLLEKNKTMNLTAITDPDAVARLHMLDCAAVQGAAELAGKRLLDVGTGAGFPGMVLKLCCPEAEVVLLDGLKKRVDWLRELSAALNVPVHCVHSRAEELGQKPQWREQFDVVTARAVADLRVLCELCLPFVRGGGVFLAMNSDHCGEEIAAADGAVALLGGRLLEPYCYHVPGTDLNRWVVRVEKVAPTPERYPRRFARIQNAPLG